MPPLPSDERSSSDATAVGSRRQGRPRSLRFQLLVGVNLVVGLAAIVFLVMDWYRESDQRIREKHVALEGEAKTLLPAIRHRLDASPSDLQHFIDEVCGSMRDDASPGHHIAIRIGDHTFQAEAHHRASNEFLRAMEVAAGADQSIGVVGAQAIVTAAAHDGDVSVYVAEYLSDVKSSVLSGVIRRTAGLGGLALLGAIVINVLLLRIVVHPMSQLVTVVRQIGAGELGAQSVVKGSAEFSVLASEISAMSSALAQASAERTRQLEKARQIQEHLRPTVSHIPGLSVAHAYQPATEVAGDYFDVIRLSDGSWLLCVADVCGHGVPAAMGAAVLKALLLAATEQTIAPGEMLEYLNERFGAISIPGDFATMILVRWQPSCRAMDYASAGHETCYIVRPDGESVLLKSTGVVLGVLPQAAWSTERIELNTGDFIVLLTDGVSEAADPQGNRLGREAIETFLADCRDDDPFMMAASLRSRVESHQRGRTAEDDLTVVVALADEARDEHQRETAVCETTDHQSDPQVG